MISKYSSMDQKKISFSLLGQLECVCGKLHRNNYISHCRLRDVVMCQDWELWGQDWG